MKHPFLKRRFKKTDVLIALLSVVFAGAVGYYLFIHYFALPVGKPASLPPISTASKGGSSTPSSQQTSRLQEISKAHAINADTVGWLVVPGTTLDMAVVQTGDNSYYLKHNLKKEYYKKGWPFLDYRDSVSPLSKNTIIYGHNVGDGTLFGQLTKYKSLDFLNQNPIIYFATAKKEYFWKIFAVYITDVNLYYIQPDFSTDSEFTGFIAKMKAQSLFKTSVDVNASDKILTLSTCTYEFTDARFVIQARLIRSGESEKTAAAQVNSSPSSPHHAPLS